MPSSLGRLQGEARSDLSTLPDDDFIAKWVFRVTPYAFRTSAEDYALWRTELAGRLGVPVEAVVVVGSAAAGVSLSPAKKLRLFARNSDIDVAVISSDHFEAAWSWMRDTYPKPRLSTIQRELIRDHMNRLVFFETIGCDRNLQEFPFGRNWFAAFESARAHPLINGRSIKARIYRRPPALLGYLRLGLNELRTNLGISRVNDA